MVKEGENHPHASTRGLVVGNYCHDVLIRDNKVIGESLGGAASFVSNVLDGLSIRCDYISKVGFDFAYSVSHLPLSSSSSKTTLFHAYFSSIPDRDGNRDRVLKRVHTCDPISPSDLPNSQFEFGLAVGVAGEILPATLERMLDLCRVVFVDIQALIRVFDPIDGTVKHVGLRESGFYHLLPRIGFLKASAEEAPFIDVQEARKWCCVVVTDGKDGCRVYWKDGEMQISPFPTTQIDPTGAGDSFLGALVAGLNWGLPVPDAALLGNFFGSLTVGHIGLPKLESWLLQRIKDVLYQRKSQLVGQCDARTVGSEFRKSVDHEDLHASLAVAAKLLSTCSNQQHQCNGQIYPGSAVEETMRNCNNHEQRVVKATREEPLQTVEDRT